MEMAYEVLPATESIAEEIEQDFRLALEEIGLGD